MYELTLKVCRPATDIADIERVGALLKERLADDMQAVALAAPQIGENIRMFIMRPGLIFINPEITGNSGRKVTRKEGCRSLPEEGFIDVSRYTSVQVTYESSQGNLSVRTLYGHEAQIAQHEIDHLNGKMIV